MILNSSTSGSAQITFLADAATTFSGFNWTPGTLASQTALLDEVDIEAFFLDEFNPKEYKLKHTYSNLKNRFILVSADDVPVRNYALYPKKIHKMLGIIRISPTGKGYRIMWGLTGVKPTRRLEQHLIAHNVAISRDPNHHTIAFLSPIYQQEHTYLFKGDDEYKYSYILWNAFPDLARIAPQGIGYIKDVPDPSEELWHYCEERFKTFNALAIQYQGLMVAGSNWDEIIALAQEIDRAAQGAMVLMITKDFNLHSDFFRGMEKSLKIKMNEEVLKFGETGNELKPSPFKEDHGKKISS